MILTTLLAAAALCGGPTTVLAPQNTTQETAEGVEILRRILVESLDKAFASETKEDHNLKENHPLYGRSQGRGFPARIARDTAAVQSPSILSVRGFCPRFFLESFVGFFFFAAGRQAGQHPDVLEGRGVALRDTGGGDLLEQSTHDLPRTSFR